jgi:class 3 adenylate cyclase
MARVVKGQSMAIAREREMNLVPDLKSRLKTFTRLLTSAKTKLRRLWDLAIQSNIMDMDDASKKALAAVEQCNASIRHIERVFPNNRFVTRQYARFADELLADHQLARELLEKSRLLIREIHVSKDHAHEWGINAYPNLPEKTSVEQAQGPGESASLGDQTEPDGGEQIPDEDEDSSVIRHYITELTFPAIRTAIVIQMLLFVVFVCGWLTFTLVYSFVVEDEMITPMNFLYHQARLRTDGYAIMCFAQQMIYDKLDGFDSRPIVQTAPPPKSVGGTWEISEQFLFFGHQMAETLQTLIEFRAFQSSSPYVLTAQTILFDPLHNYSYYSNGQAKVELVTILVGFVNVLSQQAPLIEIPRATMATLSSTPYLNIMQNVPNLCPQLLEAIGSMILFSQEANDQIVVLFLVLTIVSCALAGVLYLSTLVYIIFGIRANQERVYTCLTSLPKSQVSAIAEDLRTRKTEAEESTTVSKTNKQEDNIMKVFSAGGTSNGAGDMSTMIFCVIIILSAIIIFVVLVNMLVVTECDLVIGSSPHVTYLQGAWGLAISALAYMFSMTQLGGQFANPHDTKDVLLARFNRAVTRFTTDYVNARFGNGTIDIVPYHGYLAGATAARDKLDCPDPEGIAANFTDSSRCFPPDMVYGMMEALLRSRVQPYMLGTQDTLPPTSTFKSVWSLMIFPIYDALVEPMFASIIDTVISSVEDFAAAYVPAWCIIYPVIILFQIFSIAAIRAIETHMRGVLGLLLHFPPAVVLQTPRVMSVLCGDFATRRRDDSTKNASFFHNVVLQIPDAIITVQVETMTILSTNNACERIFGEGVAKGSMADFFRQHFQGNHERLLTPHNNEVGQRVSLVYEKQDSQDAVNLDVHDIPMGETIVYSFRDVTQTVRYNTLIAFERAKSDQMLKSILPPSLVGRVQAGEKNISFAVPSVTVVFIDIVSFTPWCGSSQADKVMMTLNNMFKRFDANCNEYSTMTRIKCIGDCYVAAGGVFDEINQPTEHAKQVVFFGLDCLASIGELNAELGETLQIRVGVNTGGPIVAGVLGGGVGKPTFEILGPAINMAQQMEHHGVPMAVHVSRSVYELIYGDTFLVKERGTMEVKGQEVVTYLVTGRKLGGGGISRQPSAL